MQTEGKVKLIEGESKGNQNVKLKGMLLNYVRQNIFVPKTVLLPDFYMITNTFTL